MLCLVFLNLDYVHFVFFTSNDMLMSQGRKELIFNASVCSISISFCSMPAVQSKLSTKPAGGGGNQTLRNINYLLPVITRAQLRSLHNIQPTHRYATNDFIRYTTAC